MFIWRQDISLKPSEILNQKVNAIKVKIYTVFIFFSSQNASTGERKNINMQNKIHHCSQYDTMNGVDFEKVKDTVKCILFINTLLEYS